MTLFTLCTGGRKEGNYLINAALNTFYLRLYGHSDSERGNPLPPHGLLFAIMVLLCASSHRQGTIYHILCYTSRGALAGTRPCTGDACLWSTLMETHEVLTPNAPTDAYDAICTGNYGETSKTETKITARKTTTNNPKQTTKKLP